ncbi:FUSC family protein [Lacinutrix iliipiscaria]|uniref:FUSC family protein n=1 Tax=Lacinutrix iliipiscaria TaxID=1230532 RepID=A0ABW5WMC3_9FLAO
MRNLFIILGTIAAILAVVLSALPLFSMAFIPAIAALIFGLAAFYISKKQNQSKKSVQLIFLLTIIALVISTYKTIFNETEVGNTEELEVREEQVKDNALEELDNIEITE